MSIKLDENRTKKQLIVDQLNEMKNLLNQAWKIGYDLRTDLDLIKSHGNVFENITDKINALGCEVMEIRDFHCEHNSTIELSDGKYCQDCLEKLL